MHIYVYTGGGNNLFLGVEKAEEKALVLAHEPPGIRGGFIAGLQTRRLRRESFQWFNSCRNLISFPKIFVERPIRVPSAGFGRSSTLDTFITKGPSWGYPRGRF